jgi:hypothetical protein
VGTSTALTLLANAVAPGVLDRYLARTGFDSQQTDEQVRAQRGNLWQPRDRDEDFGAHGEFDDEAHEHDPQVVLSRHHGAVLAALGAGAVAAAGLLGRARR